MHRGRIGRAKRARRGTRCRVKALPHRASARSVREQCSAGVLTGDSRRWRQRGYKERSRGAISGAGDSAATASQFWGRLWPSYGSISE